MNQEQEICICSAVIAEDGRIFRGHRHHHCIWILEDLDLKLKYGPSNETQGFITSRNRYVNRLEAFQLQKAAGIPSANKTGYREGLQELFSEDLY
jgi:hypothetical protein